MGHKKRTVAAVRSKTSPPLGAVSGGGGGGGLAIERVHDSDLNLILTGHQNRVEQSLAVIESDDSSSLYPAIKLECERALKSLRANHRKSLRLMKELCSKHENSALAYRVQGTVFAKVASIIDDTNSKQRYLKNAVESAKKAVSLSPNSIEFAHFYANLMYEAANEGKEYDEVIQECERALSIENPVDPAKESLQDESQQKLSTPEARIAHMQNEVRSLIQKSNIASISTWMKNLGNGEEKFRLIPLRRASEDPMELRLVQTRRPNEIKKATKTPEERRKEIEVRVAAARLLQQKSESSPSQNDDSIAVDSSSVSASKASQRRKSGNVRKNASSAERSDWVKSYWNAMSLDAKKDLLRIRISELKAHFSLLKDNLANEVLSEAISFAEMNKAWKFWMCCRCNQRFADFESHMQHILQDHMGNMLPKMQSFLPQNVDNDWIEMILNCTWKPLDIVAAIEMVDDQLGAEEPDLPRNIVEECKDSLIAINNHLANSWVSPLLKGSPVDSYNVDAVECKTDSKVNDSRWRGNGKAYCPPDRWPLSDDTERLKLLEKIHATFQLLIKHKCLASSHVNKVIQYTLDEIQSLASCSQLFNYGIDQTPLCICFLGASELRKVLKYLQDLSHACGIGRYSEKTSTIDDSPTGSQGDKVIEKIILDEEASCLVLDEQFLPCKVSSTTYSNTATTDVLGQSSYALGYEHQVPLDADTFLQWIFNCSSTAEQLASWTRLKDEKERQGTEILQSLEKDFHHLQSLYERKCEHLNYEEAVQAVEDLCIKEGKKREHVTEFECLSYESILRKRREDLVGNGNDVVFISNRFELDAISNILKEVDTLSINQFGFEESYSGLSTQLCDLESGVDDTWRTKDYLQQVDSCIEVAIQRQKEQLATELSKLDARMMHNLSGMQQMELKLEVISAHDYRSILVPLVKSFMRARLEDLAEKDATEKSDAAREAFLAELALDSKKSAGNGGEKTKDKKKNKEHKKAKDSMISSGTELSSHDTEEQDIVSSPIMSNGDHLDSGIFDPVNDVLKQEDEEFRRRIELEEEERKLEETLEYQRRIEEEAKQKHLAEQQKKTDWTNSLKQIDDDQDVKVQLNHKKEEFLILENVPANDLVDASPNIPDTAAQIGSTHEAKSVLANGESPENGVLSSERRSGRKGRRQKNSAKLSDSKLQIVPSDRGNTEIAQVRDNGLHGDCINPDGEGGGTKTLRQLKAEDDDEKRFQDDLKQAVRQSLDTFNANHKMPLDSTSRVSKIRLSEADGGILVKEVASQDVIGTDGFGTGLKNEVGEYNCFLNVIIQSLWNLRRFREEFLARSVSDHVHVGDPCVTCALYDIFTALNLASTDTKREAVAPTSLRVALSNLYPDSNFFQEAQMNDASEVMGVIFDCLHRSFSTRLVVPDADESIESNCTGSWDCKNTSCIAHSLFGMDIYERMNCYNCGLESRHLKYTSFFHNINASALRTMKVMSVESSFVELLNLVEMNHQLACDPDDGGCGKLNYIHHILSSPPHVFTTVLGWQKTCESTEDITETLATLDPEIDIAVLYRGLDPSHRHRLVSVVCYYGQHYHCFAFSHDLKQWLMYDDKTVKVIGSWGDVLAMCEKGKLQPQVLFYEAVN